MRSSKVNILAIDTATDACSVALARGGEVRVISEVIPRQHSQRLFGMLRELLPQGALREQGIDLLAYNHGPGSFTGLRIAASCVQGLAFSSGLPVAGVSTLACIAEGLRRRGELRAGQRALVSIDARIGEVYWAAFEYAGDCMRRLEEDSVGAFADIPAHWVRTALAVDSALPQAEDLLSLARREWADGKLLRADQAVPVYVREEIGWKKLSRQGRR